jgi:hypothetical protein
MQLIVAVQHVFRQRGIEFALFDTTPRAYRPDIRRRL